jgi:preprotein translocase subunit SecD
MRITLIFLLLLNVLLSGSVSARSQFTLPAPLYTLNIKANPSHATIKIMNIRLKYYHGIILSPGDYRIEVSAKGYQTKKQTVRIRHKNKTLSIKLQRNQPEDSSDVSYSSTTLIDFTTTKGYINLLRHANRLNGVSFKQEVERFSRYCNRYANLAVRQAKRRVNEGCSDEISPFNNDAAQQWSLKKAPQKAWCMTVSSYATAKETIYREGRLKDCLTSR